MAVALSSLLSRSPRFHPFFAPNHRRLAPLAPLLRLHSAMTLEHRALVHDHSGRSEVARYLGRRANLDPLGGGDLAADRSRHDDRGRLDLGRHQGALADHEIVPGDYLALDLAVDLRRPLEAELAVYLGTRIEVRARIDRFARRDAGLAQSWSGIARRCNVLPGEWLNRECGRRLRRLVGMLRPRIGFRFLAEKRQFSLSFNSRPALHS